MSTSTIPMKVVASLLQKAEANSNRSLIFKGNE